MSIRDEAPSYLIKNQAKCLGCGDVITSRSVHDYVTCSCGALSVDGGLSYAKRNFQEDVAWEELSEYSSTRPVRGEHRLEHSAATITNVHPEGSCYGSSCTIHAMTDHVLRNCEQVFDGLMWRRCPHDALHPDPDERLSATQLRSHVCCDQHCCAGAYAFVEEGQLA